MSGNVLQFYKHPKARLWALKTQEAVVEEMLKRAAQNVLRDDITEAAFRAMLRARLKDIRYDIHCEPLGIEDKKLDQR